MRLANAKLDDRREQVLSVPVMCRQCVSPITSANHGPTPGHPVTRRWPSPQRRYNGIVSHRLVRERASRNSFVITHELHVIELLRCHTSAMPVPYQRLVCAYASAYAVLYHCSEISGTTLHKHLNIKAKSNHILCSSALALR